MSYGPLAVDETNCEPELQCFVKPAYYLLV